MSIFRFRFRFEWVALFSSLSLAAACAEDIDPVDPPPPTFPDPGGSGRSAGSSSTTDAGRDVLQQTDGGWALPAPTTSSDAGPTSTSALCTINEPAEPNDSKVQPLLFPTTCGSIGGSDALDPYELTTTSTKKTITFKATGDATLTFSAFGFSQSIKTGESIDVPSFGGMPLNVRLTVQSPTTKLQSYRIDAP